MNKKKESNTQSTSTSSSSSSSDEDFAAMLEKVLELFSFIPSESELTQIYGHPLLLQRFPYHKKGGGKFSRNPESKSYFTTEIEGNYFMGTEYVQGGNIKTRLNLSHKISASAKGNLYQEEVEDQLQNLGTLYLNGSYHILSFTRIDTWVGVGFSQLFLDDGLSGYNYNLGTELYIFKPVSLYTEWYISKFDNDIRMTEGSISMKVYIHRFYLQGGYNSLNIEGVNFSGAALGLGVVI
ncbi:hypothetical protein KMW28_12995 [Flammeovirga yaeyamensis]|uniref:Uncharacterized protein n=1 Tax=Flammeovirga yaeyamensis TaxID=367791 RepID=A0AAX1MZ07_9BACT|nr:hypothetical protein [Flammeovirga yaeyamensis]MBB3695912.1 hypothetical protein [Flammeovirga yaeyamensis]NMF34601.1 hypothetical protein [Flammeovirga yaeyamensis]QWG00569.1 hypothetical protein KMW28_12995 [Flammeovirga yaeyamensis]